MKIESGLRTRLPKYLSILVPILAIFFAWFNGLRFLLPYEYYRFELFSILLCGILFLVIRARQGEGLPVSKVIIWALVVVAYLIFSVSISGNSHAGIPRLVSILSALVFGYLLWDAYDAVLNHRVVLSGVLFVLGFVAFIAVFDVFLKYYSWWKASEFVWTAPPFLYRIVGIMNSANTTMALLSIGAPAALALLIDERLWRKRILVGFWLFLYLVVVIFSSSRGGYVGAAAGFGAFVLLNFHRTGIFEWIKRLRPKRRVLFFLAVLIVLAFTVYAGYQFLIVTSAHPSHGGTAGQLNTNRSGIWRLYLDVFRNNIWFGSGIGRHLFEYFEVTGNSPPNWIPFHAHSVPLGILSEFGVIGFIVIGGFFIVTARKMVMSYLGLDTRKKLVASGVLAGLISLAAHSVFDDFIIDPTFFIVVLILSIWIVTYGEQKVKRVERVRIMWLMPVLLLVAGLRYVDLMPSKHLSNAWFGVKGNNITWNEAAEELEQALEIVPSSHHYLSQAGVFWFNSWIETQNQADLARSGEYFDRALEIEPGFSPMWANKSLVSFYSGRGEAIDEIDRAILLAPDAPIYYLNKARYLEEMGHPEEAIPVYILALEKSERYGWVTHPFFQSTAPRRQALALWHGEVESDKSFSDFIDAIEAGEIKEARQISARLEWEKDLDLITARRMAIGYILLENEQYEEASHYILDSYFLTYRPVRLLPLGWVSKWVYRTAGWDEAFLPGILMLSEDHGHLGEYEEVVTKLKGAVPEETICALQIKYNLALNGGELIFDHGSIPGECVELIASEQID